MARVSKKERYMRLIFIQKFVLKGYSTPSIVAEIGPKWNISESTCRQYIKDAKDEWYKETFPKELAKTKKRYGHRLELLLNEAWEAKQFKTVLEIQKEINKIDGLYDETKPKKKMPDTIIIREGQPPPLKAVGKDDNE